MTGRSGRRAVIDLGSATINLLVADVVRRGKRLRLVRVRTDSILVDLGRSLVETGGVGARSATLQDGIARFLTEAHDAGTIVAVGTAALRMAPDGPTVLADLERRFRIPIRLLAEGREAELGVLGTADELPAAGPAVFVDMGGGSTQVVDLLDAAITWNASLPLGAAVMAASLPDPISEDDWTALEARVAGAVAMLPPGGDGPATSVAVVVGGTARRLATLAVGDSRDRADAVLRRPDLERVLQELLRVSADAFARRHDDDPARVRMLAPGALLLGAILDRYGLAEIRTSPNGLRPGVLLASLADPDGWWLGPPDEAAP